MEIFFYPDEIKNELNKIDKIREVFDGYFRDDWIHLEHKEDFNKIYTIEPKLKYKLEKIYTSGQSLAHDIRADLEYNYIEKFPTIKVFMKNFKIKWIDKIKEFKEESKRFQEIVDINNISNWSIQAMIKLYNEEIKQIENINLIFKSIEKTDYYKKQNPSLLDRAKKHPIIIISLVLLGMVTYLDDITSKSKSIQEKFFSPIKPLPDQIQAQLSKIQIELKQSKYIYDSFDATPDFSSHDGVIKTFDKINSFQKNMSGIFDDAELYKIIKERGNKKTNKNFTYYLNTVHNQGKDLSMFLIEIINSNGFKNKQEMDKAIEIYFEKLNKLIDAYSAYHGFILGLTNKDFQTN